MSKKPKDGNVLKSDVLWIIQNYIRGIQMNDYGSDEGIPQLYAVMEQIENMEVQEVKVHNDNSICKHDWVYIGLDEYRCSKCKARKFT